ncbi:polysaccharide biosynthesis tyrosine autokinase [Bacillus timonensis]|uniref:non-specific protein-tyrosine kinase n=1 Tax=Bacillus timonensis TaxID=1033734 RepID=A0A4S3PLG5_9BACI|nr:CpsD/CapB family tyrosine-protein kinase [Bacillus timonensis]THE09492.1 polysaccharide biosynthesis tyrosine autokinase [Bacillus timonensis]
MARKKSNRKQFQMQNRSLVTMLNPKSPISEQYRTIRTNIEFSTVDEEMRTIMVTSSGPGEGKSTTTNNIAVVFAQQGKKVLLVDSDLRKPTVHYSFRINNHTGLTNVLTKQETLINAVQATEQENLFVLTSGPIPPNPAELLGSKAMDQFINEVKGLFDVVVFDTPPVLAVTDGQVLANKVDGVVVVVSSGKTETEAALKAKETLMNSKAKLLGVVLNNIKRTESQYYYYYAQK